MARLVNAIFDQGHATPLNRPATEHDLAEWMATSADQSAWHVAVDENEEVVGFQWISPHAKLPKRAADIATFVQTGQTGLVIGSALFTATSKAAKDLGYVWINATIRADNEGSLTYYQSRGFRNWQFDAGVVLDDGQIVDKVSKRFDL